MASARAPSHAVDLLVALIVAEMFGDSSHAPASRAPVQDEREPADDSED